MHHSYADLGRHIVSQNYGLPGNKSATEKLQSSSAEQLACYLLAELVDCQSTIVKLLRVTVQNTRPVKEHLEHPVSDGMFLALQNRTPLPDLMDLSVRSRNGVRRSGFKTCEECSISALLCVRQVGMTSALEIQRWIREKYPDFKWNDPNYPD